MDKKLEETLKRRASGELQIDVKGLQKRRVSSTTMKAVKPVDNTPPESLDPKNEKGGSTVFVDPQDGDLISELMGWEEETS